MEFYQLNSNIPHIKFIRIPEKKENDSEIDIEDIFPNSTLFIQVL